jgi:mannose-1-phosphate guanylyltransferase
MALMKNSNVRAVILAGGQSSRLFPFNKVVSDLTGSGRSLIQQAGDRLSNLSREQLYVLTVKDMVPSIRRQLKLPASHFFADPVRRGTWPALLWAMAHLRRENADAVIAVVTGDQVILKVREFQKAFTQAVQTAVDHPAFVVIPVKPSKDPKEWLGFGAVRGGRTGSNGSPIVGFEEKPSIDRARRMIHEGRWLWNAGMFFFRISVAEQVLETYQPAMHRTYRALCQALEEKKMKRVAKIFESFPEKIPHPLDPARLVDNTVDYAVMTPLVDVRVGPEVRHSIIAADRGHRIVVSGIRDHVVALAQGKALVLPLSGIPRIKEIVALFKGAGPIVGDRAALSSFVLKKRGGVVILSNRTKEAI